MNPVLMGLPAAKISRYMREGGVEATPEEVARLWEIYRQGVSERGFAPYVKSTGSAKWGDIFNWMVSFGTPKIKVAGFLNALERAAITDGEGFGWVDPLSAERAAEAEAKASEASAKRVLAPVRAATGGIGEAVGSLLTPALDPVTNVVKYATIAIVVGGGVYLIWKMKGGR